MGGFRLEANFRELGGYATKDGRTTRRGTLYRGPRLAELESSELELVGELGIRSILDLRSAVEAEAKPDITIAGAASYRVAGMYLPDTGEEVDFSPQQMLRLGVVAGGVADGESLAHLRDVLLSGYVSMMFDNPGLRRLFSLLLDGGPVFFHCTSGKDRTGIAAILVLLALGVSPEDALFDFALTNAYREASVHRALAARGGASRIGPEATAAVALEWGVDPSLARRALDVALSHYGSLEHYLAEELGVRSAERGRLRELYVI